MVNLSTVRETAVVESRRDEHTDPTYVMQGSAEARALDIYHLILAPSYACNLGCEHCYLPNHGIELLPREVALRIIDEWSEIVLAERGQYGGVFHVKGGEPFMVPYLWDIATRLSELRSLRFMITTNGTFTDKSIFERLSDLKGSLDGHLTIIVSLDGATEETNSLLRGNGQYATTIIFLQGLRKYGIPFYLNCVLHEGNLHEASSFVDLAKGLGASQVNFLSFIPRGNGSSSRHLQVPHLKLFDHLSAVYEDGDDRTRELLAGCLPDIKHREESGHHITSSECVAAYRGLYYITPDGNAYTCPNVASPENAVGNVYNQGLEGISQALPKLYNQLHKYNRACSCAGERILYCEQHDQCNQDSLEQLQRHITRNYSESNVLVASEDVLSFCFNRNW